MILDAIWFRNGYMILIVRIARHLPRAVIVILVLLFAAPVVGRRKIKAIDEIVTLIGRTAEREEICDLRVSVMVCCLRV